MNPLAEKLNETLRAEAPAVLEMLSEIGRRFYFPRGIITQGAEAKEKAKRFNATIGIALENGEPMHLPSVRRLVPDLAPRDIFPYAPVPGKPELRELWEAKQREENPTLRGKLTSKPIVTNALTHGLSLVSELFVDEGDVLILPDQLWGNYRLTFEVRQGGRIQTFPFFSGEGLNVAGFREAPRSAASDRDKVLCILNFPNNPSGYTPTPEEVSELVAALVETAEGGTRVIAVCDDAYFNLVYDDACLKESIFGHLAGVHPNLLAIRLDGATKEQFVWGFRVGFITFAAAGDGADLDAVHEALEKKTGGLIRGGISNSPHLSQSLLLAALKQPGFAAEQNEKREVMKARALRVKEVLEDPEFDAVWDAYPFNSGYFHCLKLKTVPAERLRLHLLDEYQLGVIATAESDIRVAFSCLEVDELEDVYQTILRGIRDLEG